jgi:biofilm PGA synthesis N-glycosyltransferase PgaC
VKFAIALAAALLWTMLSVWLSARWVDELGRVTDPLFALFAITFIAYVPGFMNCFLVTTLLLDRRPLRRRPVRYPGVSILIAAYNEAEAIADTIESAVEEDYPGELEILVLSDGSRDATVQVAQRARERLSAHKQSSVRILDYPVNRGKAAVLNEGLKEAKHNLIVTIDGDTRLELSNVSFPIHRTPSRSRELCWCAIRARTS